MGAILCMILFLTPFNIEKCMENLRQRVGVTLRQGSSNGQNYAIVCQNLTYS